MAVRLYCDPDDLGGDDYVYAAQTLGAESPLEFVDGYATVEDEEAAALLVRRRSAIHYAPDDADTCQVVKSDGEVCGRDLPCPYHSDEGEDEGDTDE